MGAPRGPVGRRRRNPTNGRPARTFGPRGAQAGWDGSFYQTAALLTRGRAVLDQSLDIESGYPKSGVETPSQYALSPAWKAPFSQSSRARPSRKPRISRHIQKTAEKRVASTTAARSCKSCSGFRSKRVPARDSLGKVAG